MKWTKTWGFWMFFGRQDNKGIAIHGPVRHPTEVYPKTGGWAWWQHEGRAAYVRSAQELMELPWINELMARKEDNGIT